MPFLKQKNEEKEKQEEREETKQKEEEKVNEVFIVTKELPTQIVRQIRLEDGSVGTMLTIEEALTEILNVVKKLEKSLL